MNKKTVFISYSHDSDEHRENVLALSERLRADGITTLLDQYMNGSPAQGWPRWMLDQLDAADSVLVVCTEAYYRWFRGHEAPGKGKGVDFEGNLITQDIYDSRSRTLKFVPIFLTAAVEKWIPEPLRSGSHYVLTSKENYEILYDFLLEQGGVEAQPVGTLKIKPRRKGTALTFDQPPVSRVAKTDISRIVKYAPAELIGREAETKILSDAWDRAVRGETKRPHILTFVALGGEGKTSLVAKWAAELAHQGWPGCETVFAWSFYHQGTDEKTADSSDLFLKEALTVFGDSAMAGSAQGAFDKGRRLAQLVGEQRALLILDGMEPLQYAPTSPTPGELKDQGIAALLKGLAVNNHGLCVVTTRYFIPELKVFWETTALKINLTRLSKEAGVVLLRSLEIKGTQQEFEALVEDVKGHALTLSLLGSYLYAAHAGDIRKRNLVKLDEAAEEQGGHAFRVMDEYVRWFEKEGEKGKSALSILRLLGLFDRPATTACLAALLKLPAIPGLTEALVGMSETQRNMAFTRLAAAKLVTVNRNAAGSLLVLDAHPLVREYFARKLRTQQSGAWLAGHRRLYEYLCTTTLDKNKPTLEDLQPLYQAVAHGCQAGLQQEACANIYRDRILRRNQNYSAWKLGAFGSNLGAVACFFESPWSRLLNSLSKAQQAWLLNEAAYNMRALGRLIEALEPMRAGLPIEIERQDWQNAAIRAGNLSELQLVLGEIVAAVGDAEQSVTYADQSGSAFWRIGNRTIQADVLHQAGRRAEAEATFREAEKMQAESQPKYPLLYSLSGFVYCDLLLSTSEHIAWRYILANSVSHLISSSVLPNLSRRAITDNLLCKHNNVRPNTVQDALYSGQTACASQIQFCRAVLQRGAQTLNWAQENNFSLLSVALERLTLSRAAIHVSILEGSSPDLCHSSLQHAVEALRRAGQQQYLPLGLLTRAWLRTLTGPMTGPDSAQTDLDEAWDIAERGPMPLFLADIHLHRARLFGRPDAAGGVERYPWESPAADLAAARHLIEKHGYLRRMEELEDAEDAARRWAGAAQ